MKLKPIIGFTMGDPAGIGPEIICKSMLSKDRYDQCNPLVVGDAGVFKNIIKRLNYPIRIHAICDIEQARFEFGAIDVLDLKNFNGEIVYGKVSSAAGLAAFESIEKLIELAMKKQVDATVTAPINKEAIHMAGKQFSGHTEIYAHLWRHVTNPGHDLIV